MFTITLGVTYRNKGFFNAGIVASAQLGAHGQLLKIMLPNGDIIESIIDRNANANGSVRTAARPALAEYFQANYPVGAQINFNIINPNIIKLL